MRLGIAMVAVVCSLAEAHSASAFCRTMSCELGQAERIKEGGQACARDASGCVTEGNPLHWPSPCIYYAVQRDGSRRSGIDGPEFERRVRKAFDAWEHAQCPGGGSPRFHAQSQGFVSCDHREAVCGDSSQNVSVMMLHDQNWPGTSTMIGLTTPSGGTTSGLVFDADLELNSEDYDFRDGATGPSAIALPDALAHEVGHFLGLAHSNLSGALMSADYAMVELTPELLTDDDVAAICAAYPPGASLDCPAPTAPAYDECRLAAGETAPDCHIASMTHEDHGGGGCSIEGAGATRPLGASPVLLFSLLLHGRIRRSARSRRSFKYIFRPNRRSVAGSAR